MVRYAIILVVMFSSSYFFLNIYIVSQKKKKHLLYSFSNKIGFSFLSTSFIFRVPHFKFLYLQNVGRRMSSRDFVDNLGHTEHVFDCSLLKTLYVAIKEQPIKWVG